MNACGARIQRFLKERAVRLGIVGSHRGDFIEGFPREQMCNENQTDKQKKNSPVFNLKDEAVEPEESQTENTHDLLPSA